MTKELTSAAKKKRRNFLILGAAIGTTIIAQQEGTAILAKWTDWRRDKRQLLIAGSGTMLQLNTALVKEYGKQHTDIDIVLEGGGSTFGLIALKSGAIDVAAMSHEKSHDMSERGSDAFVSDYLIAKNAIVFAIHQDTHLQSLSQEQIRSLLRGQIKNWRQLGGADAEVRVLSRKRNAAVRRFVEQEILKKAEFSPNAEEFSSANEVIEALSSTPFAIAYFALNELNEKAQLPILQIDSVMPTRSTVLSGRYPYTQSLYYVLKQDSIAGALGFVDFAIGSIGQRLIAQQGFIPVY